MSLLLPRHLRRIAKADQRSAQSRYCHLVLDGHEWLALWYFGRLEQGVIDVEAQASLLAVMHPEKPELIPLFDAKVHGYEAMFCVVPDAHQTDERRLFRYGDDVYRIHLALDYRIDFQAERDTFVFDDQGRVELANGCWLDWVDAQADGFDGITVLLEDGKGHINAVFSADLA